jgi:hypothetical protein
MGIHVASPYEFVMRYWNFSDAVFSVLLFILLKHKNPPHSHTLLISKNNGVSSNPVEGEHKICQLKNLILTLLG